MPKRNKKSSKKKRNRQSVSDRFHKGHNKIPGKYSNVFGSSQANIFILIFFFTLVSLIYANALDVPFIFDDSAVRDQPGLRITQLSLENFKKVAFETIPRNRPVANITFGLNYYFHKYDVLGYHSVNILIHIATSMFLYLFIKGTLKTPALADKNYSVQIPFFATVIWLVNPVHTQSVTFIYQRINSLAAMFYILALLLYITARFADKKGTKYISALGCLLAGLSALGSKENAGSLPFVILLYELFFFRNLKFGQSRRQLLSIAGVATCLMILIWFYIGTDPWGGLLHTFRKRDFTMYQRVLTEFRVVIYYIGLLLFPHPSRLNLDYDFPLSHSVSEPFTTIVCIGAVMGCICSAVYLAKKERLIAFCILWFFGTLVIESSVIGLEIIYEHRTYLPSMMLILMLTVLAFRYVKPDWLRISGFCIIIVLCSFWTVTRNQVWSDPVIFWADCVQKSPNKASPHSSLGFALIRQGRTAEAERCFSKALQIKPDSPWAHVNMGTVMERKGNVNKAIWHYNKALQFELDNENANYNLGVVFHRLRNTEMAFIHYSKALERNPDNALAHNNIGVILKNRGKLKDAYDHYTEAVRINPDYTDARRNLNFISKKIGRSAKHQGIKP
ncbi:tetratricopeptide repeat protein [Desulfococcaceae bacterium HSG7]|nr:tetratricopeptide repeat protein [Desulfococcaceae bacterium HSG7]